MIQRDEADELEINTLDDVHQSTYNPNLPARGLLYFADLYRSYMARKKLNLYSSSLQKLPVLREYIEKGLTPAQSVEQAVDECIRSGILEEFLRGHRAEVMDVILTEYNEQEHLEMERNEWEAKGLAEGLAEKSKNVIKNMLIKGMSDADIMLLVECDQAMIDNVRSSMK